MAQILICSISSLMYCKRTRQKNSELDAGQSPALARPDAPLATGVTKISSVHRTDKNWLPWQRSRGIEKN